ncbi:MAG: hypothetical protein NT167_19770 [Verrucomicrobia bacterium]|nr:hypothetical protein [Verrucomicrobiota bacterium]
MSSDRVMEYWSCRPGTLTRRSHDVVLKRHLAHHAPRITFHVSRITFHAPLHHPARTLP